MDALDILTNLEHVVPFFQPIFSADEHRIIGYEILGRIRTESGYESLGPFFLDENIPDEYRLEVDNIVLTKALERAIILDDDVLLFINRDAELLMIDDGEHLLDILRDYEHKGISLERIVLEITERNFTGDYEHLCHLLNYYRTYGIKIAIDKLGEDSSQLDQIGQISPNILKINLMELRSMNSTSTFQDILYSLSILARKIGATLLFENIESVYQLQFAWKHGGRYYQGYYLHKPDGTFVNRDILKSKLKVEFHQFIMYEKKKIEALFSITDRFQKRIHSLLLKNKNFEDYEVLLKNLAKEMNNIAFRIYICDEDGFQRSPNILKRDEEWVIQNEYMQKNWSWRPYFLENIFKMKSEKKGILSDLYIDIETGDTIRTFSYPLSPKEYLFIDITYEFLYENEELLY
ncbi:EAL domain-containing protein [Bacillus massilinigeriensis]|uniref:EAL domain-containing protein n=1 Tax=Bacillus massilionigeriensis TaxID=1805475 RepID=UPI00096B20C8|nr:EAL-associated domain-containing protein [Bacillus massilionigeriensis]